MKAQYNLNLLRPSHVAVHDTETKSNQSTEDKYCWMIDAVSSRKQVLLALQIDIKTLTHCTNMRLIAENP